MGFYGKDDNIYQMPYIWMHLLKILEFSSGDLYTTVIISRATWFIPGGQSRRN